MTRPEQHAVNGMRRESRVRGGKGSNSLRYPDSLVNTIRGLYRAGKYGYAKLAAMFHVPRSTVRKWIKFEIRKNPRDDGVVE